MVGLDNPLHLAILLAVLLLIFGAKRLPELGRSLGAGMRGFKEAVTGESNSQPATELPARAGDRAVAQTPDQVGARPPAQ
ncbi:MAG: twin-arginine translocase TatA/TatE family subunit [Solirubrobacterales bacterium]|nr:twin-arginine translocase TatA/TatE family subunit [Solirubrobacterales bacterium]